MTSTFRSEFARKKYASRWGFTIAISFILLPAAVLPLPFHLSIIYILSPICPGPLNFAPRCGFTITISLRHCIHRLLYPALYFIGHLKFCSSLGFYHCHSLRHDIHHLLHLSFYLSWSGPARGRGQGSLERGLFLFAPSRLISKWPKPTKMATLYCS